MNDRETLAKLRLQLDVLQESEAHHEKVGQATGARAKLARMIATAKRTTEGAAVEHLERQYALVPSLEAICRRCPSRKPCAAFSVAMADLESKILAPAERTSRSGSR